MREKELKVTFPISTTRGSSKEKHPGEQDEYEVARTILLKTAKHATERADGFLFELQHTCANLRLIDRTKRVLDLNQGFYKAYVMDKVQFLAAEVENMEIYGNKDCYAKISYAGGDKIYHGSAMFSAATYYRIFDEGNIDESRPIYLIGTCVRKTHTVPAKKAKNKFTRQIITTKEENTIKRTKMLHFYLGNLPAEDSAMPGTAHSLIL